MIETSLHSQTFQGVRANTTVRGLQTFPSDGYIKGWTMNEIGTGFWDVGYEGEDSITAFPCTQSAFGNADWPVWFKAPGLPVVKDQSLYVVANNPLGAALELDATLTFIFEPRNEVPYTRFSRCRIFPVEIVIGAVGAITRIQDVVKRGGWIYLVTTDIANTPTLIRLMLGNEMYLTTERTINIGPGGQFGWHLWRNPIRVYENQALTIEVENLAAGVVGNTMQVQFHLLMEK